MLSTFFMLALAVANAQEPEAKTDESVEEVASPRAANPLPLDRAPRVLRASRAVSHVGWALDLGGLALGSYGLNSGSELAYGLGSTLSTGGHVMVMSGQLRQARALQSMGYDVSRTPGLVAWSLWGAGQLTAAVGAGMEDEGVVLAGGALALGSYLPMVVQGVLDFGAAPRELVNSDGRVRYRLAVVPEIGLDHQAISLTGTF